MSDIRGQYFNIFARVLKTWAFCTHILSCNGLKLNADYSGCKAREHSEPKWKLMTNYKDSVFNKYVKISEEFKKLEMDRTWDNIPQHIIKPKQARK